MGHMFDHCKSIKSVTFRNTDNKNCVNWWGTFNDCNNIETINNIDLKAAFCVYPFYTNCPKVKNLVIKNIGYTDEQVSKIRELAKEAEKTGTPINELIADISKPSGRELLIDSFSNALQGIKRAIDSVKKAWTDIFPPISIEEKQEKLQKEM